MNYLLRICHLNNVLLLNHSTWINHIQNFLGDVGYDVAKQSWLHQYFNKNYYYITINVFNLLPDLVVVVELGRTNQAVRTTMAGIK